ncbi:MAG: hypothetical protein ACJAZO_001194 [Myxococcota bacterium]|jgi:hypothetical protein
MLRVLPCLLLSGCCCCWPFGGDDGFVSNYVSEVIAEEFSEQLVESMTGVENVEIGEDGSFTATGPDGKSIEMRMGDDGQMVMTTADASMTFGAGEIPEGFPITPYPDSEVMTVMDMPDGQMITVTSGGSKEELLAYYRLQLEAFGTVETGIDLTTPDGDMASIMVTPEGSPTMMVMIMSSSGEPTTTSITVTP